MQFFSELYTLLVNLGDEKQWTHFIEFVGGANTVYVVMFAIIFCETGLVIMPFLPGDSLLFAIGFVAAMYCVAWAMWKKRWFVKV